MLTAGLLAGFGIFALAAFVWRLFDENVARPIDTVAAALRARAHGGVHDELEPEVARYLGDPGGPFSRRTRRSATWRRRSALRRHPGR
ncbi:hypothetical protein [Mangrovicoccus ximenensis]|uniref:hypothetical protein n=1 Tax=Mangrovicoccus ximenensis TaxID=1911570 RepID=UPI000D376140|nr:hypothetical protein [Mangrovicoccus ximenensis]